MNDDSSWANSPAASGDISDDVPMDEGTAHWAAVLARLSVCYPLSPYAKMGRADLEADAALWASEMREVPTGAIEELYRRTLNRKATSKDFSFPPNLGDFRAAWLDPDWDYWAQRNAQPALPALPAPAPRDGPGARSAAAQNQYRHRHGEFVCCQCLNDYGFPDTAVLRGESWVCAGARCGFVLPFEADTEVACSP